MSELQIPPSELRVGDTILAISPNRRNFKVRRPDPRPVPSPLTTIRRTYATIKVGDVIVCPNAAILDHVSHVTTGATPGSVRPQVKLSVIGTGDVGAHSHERRHDEGVQLAAEERFLAPGWVPPEHCPRCRRLFRNWLECTCTMSCGRTLDCNGLKG